MARTTMTPLITYLREQGNASTTDEFLGGTYWDNDQLEAILDEHAEPTIVSLTRHSQYSKRVYKVLLELPFWLEEGFTIYVQDTTTIESTTYTYNHKTRTLTFDSDVADRELVISGNVIVMSDAIGDLWNRKAQQREDYTTFKAGTHRIEAKQIYDHCIMQRDFWYNFRIRSVKRNRLGLFT